MAIQYLRDCPYFVGPFAPSKVIAIRAMRERKAAKRAAFIGPPKPHNRGLKYKTKSKFDWAEGIDTSTPEGKKEYMREYSKRWYRKKFGGKPHKAKSAAEIRATKRASSLRRDKKQRGELKDKYVRRHIREQFGVKNPPQELIELKRVQLKITRALNNEHS